MDFGDAKGDGTGYWLKVTLRSGETLRGATYRPRNGLVKMLVPPHGLADFNISEVPPTFVRCLDVVAATVEW
jgi:hypothetical protein